MRNECNIIRDLLPLYAENMVSLDTADFVDAHLKGCATCRKEYERTKEPQMAPAVSPAVPLVKLSRKMKGKRLQTIALTAVFVIALLVSAFAVLDAPIYLPYSEGIVTAEQLGDKGMLLTFEEEVTAFDYTVYADPDGGDFDYCEIQAWTSLWDKWFSQGRGALSTEVIPRSAKPILAVYVPNDGSENVCIAKYDPNGEPRIEKSVGDTGAIALPRLALGTYFLFAATAGVGCGIAWLFLRKKREVRVWIERIGLYPVAYILSHVIVAGFSWASYSMPRDFALIVFLSILLYSGLLLAHNIWRLKREIQEMNP